MGKDNFNNNEGKYNAYINITVCDIYRKKNYTQITNNRDDGILMDMGTKLIQNHERSTNK